MSSLEILAMSVGLSIGVIMLLWGIMGAREYFLQRKPKKYSYYVVFFASNNDSKIPIFDNHINSCEVLRSNKIKTINDLNDLCKDIRKKYGYKNVLVVTIYPLNRTRRYAE